MIHPQHIVRDGTGHVRVQVEMAVAVGVGARQRVGDAELLPEAVRRGRRRTCALQTAVVTVVLADAELERVATHRRTLHPGRGRAARGTG